MKYINKAIQLIKFYFSAITYKNIDNKPLSDLVYRILELRDDNYRFTKIEQLRKALLKDDRILIIDDLGAGSTFSNTKERSIKSIAKSAVSPKWQCEVLYRTVNEFLPETIIEMGTSLGISTAYLAIGNIHGIVHTMEGSDTISTIAMRNFNSIKIKNFKLITGNFDITLPLILSKLDSVDFAFVDGNHSKKPTIDYFNQLLSKSNKHTVMVFDDIHWSKGMNEAWNEIKSHEKVTASLDFYSFGMIFFDNIYNGDYKVITRKYKL